MKHIPLKPVIQFLCIILVMCIVYYANVITMLPFGIHSWAQSDRLALSYGFYDNGMNLFMPRTFSLLPTDGVTGVEFPIQAYVAACMGKLLGRDSISISFRILDTLISLTGLTFLFLAAYKRTKDFLFSLLSPLFIFCSPVFIYYTCSYIPDTAATSIVFIAFYFLLNYIDEQKNKDAVVAVLLLGLATLIKTSALIFLFGGLCFIFFNKLFVKEQRTLRSFISYFIASLVVLGAVFAYYQYNAYLNEKYDSQIFLAAAKPFQDHQAVTYYIDHQVRDVYLKEYFVLPEYILWIGFFLPGVYFLGKTRNGIKQLILSALFVLLSWRVAYLLGMQLIGHDYYAIVILLTTLVLIFTITVIAVRQNLQPRVLKRVRIFAGFFLILNIGLAAYQSHERLRPDYEGYNPGKLWFANDIHILDSLQIPGHQQILVFNEDPTNLALLHFNRRGICLRKEWWDGTIASISNTMSNKNLSILLLKAKDKDIMQQQDSVALSHFHHLATTDSTIVYRYQH